MKPWKACTPTVTSVVVRLRLTGQPGKEYIMKKETDRKRRTMLRVLAGTPLALTITLLASPVIRFLRPTLAPLDILGASDQPDADPPIPTFSEAMFPSPWTCIPFVFNQSYVVYNPEDKEVRTVPGFIVRLPNNDIVAYSRICPHLGCIFNFVKNPEECEKSYNYKPNGPVFACPCHLSVYDIAQAGKVVSGPAPRPPRKFELQRKDDQIRVVSLEAGSIA